jgi:hypothetical protein
MKRSNYHILLHLTIVLLCGVFFSCTENLAGGSGSTTTNGFSAHVVMSSGAPVGNAEVHVRPSGYCVSPAGISGSRVEGTVLDTITDAKGAITIGGLVPGMYTVEIFCKEAGEGVVFKRQIIEGDAEEVGKLVTSVPGSVKGVFEQQLEEKGKRFFVQVYGMERIAEVDSVNGAYTLSGLPPSEYALRIAGLDTTEVPIDVPAVKVSSGQSVQVERISAWRHEGLLTVNGATAGLNPTDTLFDFPLLLRLTSTNFDFSSAKKKGEDLRIVKSNNVLVSFEIEQWDSANGTAAIWIKVDTLCGSSPEKEMHLYWGNKRGSTFSSGAAVFDTVAGFRNVWHLGESGGKVHTDATGNNRQGTPSGMDGANDVGGITGRAQVFDSDSQNINFSAVSKAVETDSVYSFSLWVKPSGGGMGKQSIFRFDNSGLEVDSSNNWVFSIDGNQSCTTTVVSGKWSYVTCVRNGSRSIIYVNGIPADSANLNGELLSSIQSPDDTLILGWIVNSTGWYRGIIEEFRIYSQVVTPAWVRLCYVTQKESPEGVTFKVVK